MLSAETAQWLARVVTLVAVLGFAVYSFWMKRRMTLSAVIALAALGLGLGPIIRFAPLGHQ